MSFKNTAAIILAAGKGTRIKAKKINKTMMPLAGRPMVAYAVERLKRLDLGQIILVVGFAKKSIMKYFNKSVIYAEQKKRLGTGHAAKAALAKLKKSIGYVLIFYGDDSAFYPKNIFIRLIKACQDKKLALSFLTLEKKNPFGLGRIVRNKQGEVVEIVEEKNTDLDQKKIKEVNLGCYCFERKFLEENIRKIKKNTISGEYYLTDIVKLAVESNQRFSAIQIKNEDYWHGVNTPYELDMAQEKMAKINGAKKTQFC